VPKPDVARVEGGEQRVGVARLARSADRRGAQRPAAAAAGRVVERDREPGEQPRAQRRVVDGGERLLQQRDPLLVETDDRHAEPARREHRAAEQLRVAGRARGRHRPRTCVVGARVAGADERVRARKQQRP
jgi:hypothetical protein